MFSKSHLNYYLLFVLETLSFILVMDPTFYRSCQYSVSVSQYLSALSYFLVCLFPFIHLSNNLSLWITLSFLMPLHPPQSDLSCPFVHELSIIYNRSSLHPSTQLPHPQSLQPHPACLLYLPVWLPVHSYLFNVTPSVESFNFCNLHGHFARVCYIFFLFTENSKVLDCFALDGFCKV